MSEIRDSTKLVCSSTQISSIPKCAEITFFEVKSVGIYRQAKGWSWYLPKPPLLRNTQLARKIRVGFHNFIEIVGAWSIITHVIVRLTLSIILCTAKHRFTYVAKARDSVFFRPRRPISAVHASHLLKL